MAYKFEKIAPGGIGSAGMPVTGRIATWVAGTATVMCLMGSSGALAQMLTSVAEFYEEEVATRLQRTLIWVSPAILVVMAVVVGFILISLYLPLFSLQVGTGG